MKAKYIFRLDDASEYMHYDKWEPFFELFDKYGVIPIIAAIPFNKDPKMISDNPDITFWDRLRALQKQGYRIAMHGYEHLYSVKKSGPFNINKKSEFAGVGLLRQTEMLHKAYEKFESEGIRVDIFVAPGHTFDKNTLKGLKSATNIRYISDGFYLNPVKKNGLFWIPQQLWTPQNKKRGVWTICLHPETSGNEILLLLESFLFKQGDNVIDPLSLKFNKLGFGDILYWLYGKTRQKMHRILTSVLKSKNSKK